jgi:hypothetical protein
VRFQFIESMATQATKQSASIAKLVHGKTLQAIHGYSQDLVIARENAAALLKAHRHKDTHNSLSLQQLFDRCEYREVERITARPEASKNLVLLKGLTAALTEEKSASDSDDEELPFHELITRQEEVALGLCNESGLGPVHSASKNATELKSTRRFRDSRAKARADQVVRRAIEECPEDAGPLNPQRLTIDSLAAMRELSPHYLIRFVEHIDTLLWLETLGKQAASVAAKKTSGKSKRSKSSK